jgi:hypothetical protein
MIFTTSAGRRSATWVLEPSDATGTRSVEHGLGLRMISEFGSAIKSNARTGQKSRPQVRRSARSDASGHINPRIYQTANVFYFAPKPKAARAATILLRPALFSCKNQCCSSVRNLVMQICFNVTPVDQCREGKPRLSSGGVIR